ncbi:GNAT family N-acetyltransferase [Lederbergia citrea]|uniref:GNAT family N-acetyltransferase n=1 Tax=Lederbergia citrea TaxID=2833581 RepID=A0A942UMN6_9BACI|nr:GNAT family N-acetyltransferase [Lederbergia citrea]MBS4221726.1 GNAT family N-acetyltransferase [Lederbergia citrea]
MNQKIEIRVIKPEETYPIRHFVLRPNQMLKNCVYPGDQDVSTFHLGAFYEGKLVGIASYYLEGNPEFKEETQYRLRGMATLTEYRGMEAGKQLIREAEKIMKNRGAELWWCNARTSASGFYEKLGLSVHGEVFDIDPIGPHKMMVRNL